MNRSCPDMQDRITDYMLGAPDGSDARIVEEHLAGCEGCRQYLSDLKRQGDALVALGGRVAADTDARQGRVIQALEGVAPGAKTVPILGGFARIAVAAVLVLGVGVLIGRATAPRPVDAEKLRTELEASILAGLDQRLQVALASNDTKLRVEVAEQIGRDLRLFASEFTASSEELMDRRFTELVEVIEAARLTDRRQVARALEQIKAQTGAGLQSVAALTAGASKATKSAENAENL